MDGRESSKSWQLGKRAVIWGLSYVNLHSLGMQDKQINCVTAENFNRNIQLMLIFKLLLDVRNNTGDELGRSRPTQNYCFSEGKQQLTKFMYGRFSLQT